jgi:hypothetical protein
MKRAFLIIILNLSLYPLFAQNGYVKLDNGSMITGYLKHYRSIKDGHPGIEVWRSKKDKEPLKIAKWKIDEYAIKKDTFRVLTQFRPFHDTPTYFELVEAKLKSSGKISLFIISNYQNANRVSTYTGGGVIPALIDESLGNHTFMYLIEDKETGFLKALPSKKNKLMESLLEFFPQDYITRYAEIKGEINYRSLPDLVNLYNSK